MFNRSTVRNALFVSALLFAAMMTSSALAREATVTLKDGTKMSGDVIGEDAQVITLMIAGIRTPIARERIQDVAYVQTLGEQFKERRARIADDNQEERYKLIRWLIDNKAWELAQPELSDYAKKFPEDDRSKYLQRIIDSKKKVIESEAPAEEKTPAPVAKPREKNDKEKEKSDVLELLSKRLTEDQINMIRIYEIDPDAKPAPYVSMKPDVIDDLFKNYADVDAVPKGKDKQDKFRGLPGNEKLKVFFAAKARDLYPRIKITADPEGIKVFREKIHSIYVLNYCGTNECHGGLNAGSFFVFNREPANVDQTVYTNFYILHQYEKGRSYMLNFEKPDESYLLQYGLPVAQAAFPHPQVKNWRPSFFSPNDSRFQIISKWIGSFPVRADYGINWTSPVAGHAAPATQPAAESAMPGTPAVEPAQSPQTPPPANPSGAPHTSGPDKTRPIIPKP